MEEEKLPIADQLEEQAVGQSTNGPQWSEFPEDAVPQDEKPSGPLSERIVSKQVKAKQSAFEELLSLIEAAQSSEDSICKEYTGKFSLFLKESNPLLLEKAVQIIGAWLQKASMKARKEEIEWEKIVSLAIEKGVGSGKPNIKKISLDIVCDIFEAMEDVQQLIDIVIANMNNKLAKTSVAGMQTMLELLDSFGLQKLSFLKPFIPAIEKIQGMTNLGQRTEAMNFYKEAYKWLGEPMKELMKAPISKLKKAQQDEIEKFFSEWDLTQVMKGKRVKEVAVAAAGPQAKGKAGASGGGAAASGGIDVYEMSDPVDIFTKQFNEAWTEKVASLEKWIEKKDEMEEFLKTSSNITKMQSTANFWPIVQMCKKILMQEPNFNVVVAGIKIAGAMAKGLRKNYQQSAKLLFPLILDKFRDKKTIMIDETHSALEKFFYAISPEEIMQDIDKALQQKNAGLKINTIVWLEKYFESYKESPETIEALAVQFLGKFKGMIEDGDAKVREKVFQTLVTLKLMYPKQYTKIMSEVNPQKLAIIQKLEDKLTNAKQGGDKNKKGGKADQSKVEAKIEEKELKSESPKKAKQSKQEEVKAEKKEKKEEILKFKDIPISQWEKSIIEMNAAEELLKEAGFPEKTINELGSTNTQEKTKNLQAISNNENDILIEVEKHLELFLLVLKAKTKEFKESTLIIQKEIMNLLLVLATRESKPFNSKCFSVIVQYLLDKFGDNKYSEQIGAIINSLEKNVSPAFIVLSFLELADIKKGPKIFSDLSKYISDIYANAEGKDMPTETLFNFAKTLISSSTNMIFKNSAIQILKTIYKFHSKIVEREINDLTPQLIKTLQNEFEKVEILQTEQVAPVKIEIIEQKKEEPQTGKFSKSKKKQEEEETKVQEKTIKKEEKKSQQKEEKKVISKEEKKESLSKSKTTINKKKETIKSQSNDGSSENEQPDLNQTLPKMLPKFNSQNWNERSKAFEDLTSLFTSESTLSTFLLNELTKIIRDKLNDPHKNVKKVVVIFVAKFIQTFGAFVKTLSPKQLLEPLVQKLTDKVSEIRAEGVVALDNLKEQIGPEQIIITLADTILPGNNADARILGFQWILTNSQSLQNIDKKIILKHILNALTDKNKEIKHASEKIFEIIFPLYGIKVIKNGIRDFKPAIIQEINNLIEKIQLSKSQQLKPDNQSDAQDNISEVSSVTSNSKSLLCSSSRQSKSPSNNLKRRQLCSSKQTAKTQIQQQFEEQQEPDIVVQFQENALIGSAASLGYQKHLRCQNPFLINNGEDIELPENEYTQLEKELKPKVHESLSKFLFSHELEKLKDGVSQLLVCCEKEFENLVEISDLMFRWVLLRILGTTNASVVQQVFQLLRNLVKKIREEKIRLNEFEWKILFAIIMQHFKLCEREENLELILSIQIIQLLAEDENNSQQMSQYWMDHMLKTKNDKLKLPIIKIIKNVFIRNCEPYLKELSAIKEVKDDNEFISKLVGKFGQDKLIFMGFQISQNDLSGSNLSIIREESVQLQESKNSQKQEEKMQAPSLRTILEKFQKSLPRLTRSMTAIILDQQLVEELDDFIVNEEISLPHFLKILKLFVNCDLEKHMEQIISCLMVFNDLAVSKNQFHWMILEQNANQVVLSLIVLLAKSLDNQKKLQEQFLDYFLNMFIKIITLKPLLTTCSVETLAGLLEYLLSLLLWETEELKTISGNQSEEKCIIESILKWVNKILIRVLEVSNPSILLSGLLSLLISQNKEDNSEQNLQSICKVFLYSNQFQELINGCLIKFGKLIPTYAKTNRGLDIPVFIQYAMEYIELISLTFKTKNLQVIEKDARIQTIKYLFYQIYFNYSEEDKYKFEKMFEESKEKTLFFLWVQQCCNQYKTQKQIQLFLDKKNQQQPVNTEIEKQLEILIDNLYNNKSFNKNLEQLFNLLFTHQTIILGNYLKKYPELFQELIKQALDSLLKIKIKNAQGIDIQSYLTKILPMKQETYSQNQQQNYYHLVKNRYRNLNCLSLWLKFYVFNQQLLSFNKFLYNKGSNFEEKVNNIQQIENQQADEKENKKIYSNQYQEQQIKQQEKNKNDNEQQNAQAQQIQNHQQLQNDLKNQNKEQFYKDEQENHQNQKQINQQFNEKQIEQKYQGQLKSKEEKNPQKIQDNQDINNDQQDEKNYNQQFNNSEINNQNDICNLQSNYQILVTSEKKEKVEEILTLPNFQKISQNSEELQNLNNPIEIVNETSPQKSDNSEPTNWISLSDLISSPSKIIQRQQLAKHKINIKKCFNQQYKRKKFKFHPIYQRLHGIRKWILFQKYKKTKIKQFTVQRYKDENFIEDPFEEVSNFSEAKIEINQNIESNQSLKEIIKPEGKQPLELDSEEELNDINSGNLIQTQKGFNNYDQEDEVL